MDLLQLPVLPEGAPQSPRHLYKGQEQDHFVLFGFLVWSSTLKMLFGFSDLSFFN